MRRFVICAAFFGALATALAGCDEEHPGVSQPFAVPPATYNGCQGESLIVREMAFSLDSDPTGWRTDGFRMIRTAGGAMWVANGAHHVEIGPSEHQMGLLDGENEQACLYAAFQRWLHNTKNY